MTQSVDQALEAFSPDLPLTVAYSGGADSSALLLACVKKWPGQVQAVHVNHRLQPAADGFEQHVRGVCANLGVALKVYQVHARNQTGESPEDAARKARYAMFKTMASERADKNQAFSLALAQHADDQVETMLLALSRGAGLPGISGMAASSVRDGVHYLRPFLQLASSDIRRWLSNQGVSFIEDPSNADQRFTRNRIRSNITPALQACFAHYRDTFARSAAHAAQAQLVLDDVAAQDLLQVGEPPRIRALQALSEPRRANVLRHWFKKNFQVVPSTAQMTELVRQIRACTTRGHDLDLKIAGGRCQRRGPVLHWYNP